MKLIMDNVKSFGYGVFSFFKVNRKFLLIIIFCFCYFVADSERNNKIMLSHIDFALLGFFKVLCL
jgi:uncharacterized membrane protein